MEHSCYRCQAEIPENTAFCPHCGAPQIRVIAPEGQTQEPSTVASDTADAAIHAAAPPPPAPWMAGAAAYPPPSGSIQWKLAWKSALLLGIGAAALFTITAPLIQMLSFVWLGVAGVFAARSYGRNVAHTAITPGMGMKLGALTGLFGALPIAVMTLASFAAIGSKPELGQALQEQMRRQMPANADPRMQEMMRNMLAWVSTPQGEATMVLFLVLVFVVLSAAGGALGASISGRRHQPR